MNENNNSNFLSLFSKLMEERADKQTETDNKINELKDMINGSANEKNKTSLREILSNSVYPASPLIMQKLDEFVFSITEFSKCPEILNKPLIYANFSYKNAVLDKLKSIKLNVPVIILKSSEYTVSCMTYANKRICFTRKEFFQLAEEAAKENIDIKTIIKYIVINAPYLKADAAVLFDENNESESFFSDYIDLSITNVKGDIWDNVNNDIKKKYKGIYLRYQTIIEPLKIFYHQQIRHYDEMSVNITDDLVKLGGDNQLMSQMRTKINELKDKLEREYNKISSIIQNLNQNVKEIENLLGGNLGTGFTTNTVGYLFELIIMNCEAGCYDRADEYLSIMEKAHTDFVEKYINCYKTSTEYTYTTSPYTLYKNWQVNKMIFALTDLSTISLINLKRILYNLNEHITTAKEKYALAVYTYTEHDKNRINLLKESFLEGYAPAGKLLFERYGSDSDIEEFLSELLYPDACIKKGKEAVNEENSFFLHENGFLWYKLAASSGNVEAVKLLVDRVYELQIAWLPGFYCSLSYGRQRDIDALMVLCNYLISNDKEPLKYSHILGILYYLKQNFTLAMEYLSGSSSQIALYCKGKMCENGWGTAVNLNQAVSYYSRAGSFEDASQKVQELFEKIRKKQESAKSTSSYSSTTSYKSKTSNHSSYSSGGCFITTATIKNLKAADDCEELELMRSFRDKYLVDSDIAQALVLEYYKVAPEICKCIDESDDCDKVYQDLWDNHILPSIACIRSSKIREAQVIYINMTLSLAKKYGVQVNDELVSKYISLIHN